LIVFSNYCPAGTDVAGIAENYKAGGTTALLQKKEVESHSNNGRPIAQETVTDGQRILASISKENCK
jgi:pyruvate dehydrogenase E2 component (dihydrolipoamide acetyltransferase)